MFCTQYIKHDRLVDLILIPAKQSFDLHLLALYLTVTRCICTVYMITTTSVLRLTHGAPQAIRFKVNKYSQPDFLTFLFNSFYLMATIVDMSKGNCLFVIRSEFASLCLGKKNSATKTWIYSNWKISMAVFVCDSIAEIHWLGIILWQTNLCRWLRSWSCTCSISSCHFTVSSLAR